MVLAVTDHVLIDSITYYSFDPFILILGLIGYLICAFQAIIIWRLRKCQ
jgi:hypothetical protein